MKLAGLPVNLENVSVLLESLDGRDKLCKAVQYWSKFGHWFMLKREGAKASRLAATFATYGPRLQSLSKSMSTSRKAFRVLKTAVEYKKTLALLKKYKGWAAQEPIAAAREVLALAARTGMGICEWVAGDRVCACLRG